jgi:transposase
MDAQIEQLDDIPIIFGIIKKMNLITSLDSVFIAHKNWKGITIGELTAIWLCYLITSQDHRISYFAEWAKVRLQLLSTLLSKDVSIYDCSDDKLELLLDMYCQAVQWHKLEVLLNQDTIRIFDLQTDILRVDATIGKSFQKVITNGLLQYGNSKHFRNDLPQFKTMLCSLDPLGYPMSSLTVSGNSADDPLYVPVIQQTIASLPHLHSLFVGDCKLGSLATRAFIEKNGHNYLCPLSGSQLTESELREYIYNIDIHDIELEKIWKDEKIIAKGYSTTKQLWKIDTSGELILWTEKRFIVRSYEYAKTQIEALLKRIDKCVKELSELNIKKQGKQTFEDKLALESECKRIIKKYDVAELVSFEIEETVSKKQIRAWKNRPAREETQSDYTVKIMQDKIKIAQKKKLLGWRVYAINSTDKDFTLQKAVLIYRQEYIIERRFDCLKNKPLNLTPLYLQKDNRIEGLINVLLLALRIISLIEFKVADSLEKNGKELSGLYAGNPKHKTTKPTAMLILRAFLGIYIVVTPNLQESKMIFNVTNLAPLQKKLLRLLDLPETVYTNFKQIVDFKHNNMILKI